MYSLLVASFVRLPLEDAIKGVRCILDRNPQKWRIYESPLETSRIYVDAPQRGGRLPIIAAMWQPKSLPDWTAFMPNSSDGWQLLMSRLHKRNLWPDIVSVRSSERNYIDQIQEIQWCRKGAETVVYQAISDGDQWAIFRKNIPRSWAAYLGSGVPDRCSVFTLIKEIGLDLESEETWQTAKLATYIEEVR